MKAFLANILLAIIWRAATPDGGLASLAVGFVIGYLVLWWMRPLLGDSQYFRNLPLAVRFALFYLRELVLSNLRVAHDVLTPAVYRRPGIIAVPLDAQTDIEIALLANLVTLTPGTLSIDVSSDRRTLYIHAMFVDDVEQVRREIKDGLEKRVLELLR